MADERKEPPSSPDPAGKPPEPAPGPPPLPGPRGRGALWKWLMHLLLPIGVASGLLVGLVALGHNLGGRLQQRGGPTVQFLEIDCDSPVGMSRQEFLEEAQYLAGLPDRLDALATDTPSRIHAALTGHPWVRVVDTVRVLSGGRVRAELKHRVPVLAVARPARVVDGAGILLPGNAKREGLPTLQGTVAPPAGRPGQGWGDVRVVAAAQVAEKLAPHLRRLGLTGCEVEVSLGVVTLRTQKARLVWGWPPGQERTGEASAEMKLARLPDGSKLAGKEFDLRPVSGAKQRPLR